MNKKLQMLLEEINEKKMEVANLAQEDKLDEAAAAKEELKELQRKFDLLKDVMDEASDNIRSGGGKPFKVDAGADDDPQPDPVHDFAQAARAGFPVDVMTEGTDADGGYTVPEDIQTKINKYKDTHYSLRHLVRVEPVKTDKGARTFQKKTNVSGFQKVAENGAVQAVSNPKFERQPYEISSYAGYLPVTKELLADSDANITNTVTDWLGENSLATDNNEVVGVLRAKTPVNLVNASNPLKPIKHAINVTLGQAYAGNIIILTNDSGLDWLDNLVDTTGRPLLNPSLVDPGKMVLRVGARLIPVEVAPENVLDNDLDYIKTVDTALVSGKTYYTRSGSGTAESPYTYTAVESPAVASIGTYYEKTGIPMFVGDLKEAVTIFDRQKTTIVSSSEASVTGYNAFEQRGRIFLADVRADYEPRDDDAYVYGCLPALA